MKFIQNQVENKEFERVIKNSSLIGNSGVGKGSVELADRGRVAAGGKAGDGGLGGRFRVSTKRIDPFNDVNRIAQERLKAITRNLQSDYKHRSGVGGVGRGSEKGVDIRVMSPDVGRQESRNGNQSKNLGSGVVSDENDYAQYDVSLSPNVSFVCNSNENFFQRKTKGNIRLDTNPQFKSQTFKQNYLQGEPDLAKAHKSTYLSPIRLNPADPETFYLSAKKPKPKYAAPESTL